MSFPSPLLYTVYINRSLSETIMASKRNLQTPAVGVADEKRRR
jgi:hypothetical protein